MSDPFWCDPASIEFKISPVADLKGTVGGDWDQDRRHAFSQSVKYRAMVQRFVNCLPWERTDLFREVYARRFAKGESVRGERSERDLILQYYDRIDAMAEDMRVNGFRLHRADGREHPLPQFLIGRDGAVFIGNQGNHRLALAKVLKLGKIAGRIICRHSLA